MQTSGNSRKSEKNGLWSSWKPSHRFDPSKRIGAIKRKWLDAPSSVADLVILPNNTTAVICFRGQILNLANTPHSSATVLWQTYVQMPKRKWTQLCHAAFDSVTCRLYFTVCPFQEGILWSDLGEIEYAAGYGTKSTAVELKYLTKNGCCKNGQLCSKQQRQFWGLATIPELQLIACCHRNPNSIGFWSASKQDGDTQSGCLLKEIYCDEIAIELNFVPFRCATFTCSPTVSDEWKVLLAVDDYKNSLLRIFGVVARKPATRSQQKQHEDELNQALKLDHCFEASVANKGCLRGSIWGPDGLHFDPDGQLLVADSGNLRIQMFAHVGGIQSQWKENFTLGDATNHQKWHCIWSSCHANTTGRTDYEGPEWCSMKVSAVVAPLDSKTGRPFLLAGMWDDEDVVCFS